MLLERKRIVMQKPKNNTYLSVICFKPFSCVYLYSFGEVPNSLIKHLVKYEALLKPT